MAAFKAEFQNPALSDFDSLVTDLHEFDELRYPDSTLANGMGGDDRYDSRRGFWPTHTEARAVIRTLP